MIRVRRKKDSMKPPSTWSRLSWIERLVMYGAPILIIWILYMICEGRTIHRIDTEIMETHIEEMKNVEYSKMGCYWYINRLDVLPKLSDRPTDER